MIWRNPFQIRQAEKIDTDNHFIQLFSSETLSSVSEESFGMIQYVESTPGAGKTTLFKALQPNILASLKEHDDMSMDFYKKAMQLQIIDNDGVKLLSCIVSCAKNYDLIDSTFQNGRRQQVLFALINVRITIHLLKNMMNILGFEDLTELENITFVNLPDEFIVLEEQINNGYELYRWSQREERKICYYLDELSDEKTNFTFINNDLFFLKLFEPHNLLYKGNRFLNYTLVILDDVQQLTSYQRELIIKTLYTMRPNLAVWIGERIEALSDIEIITNDATKNREYTSIRLEDCYWDMKKGFSRILSTIADRRIKLQDSEQITSFNSCFDDVLQCKPFDEKLKHFVKSSIDKIIQDEQFGKKYFDISRHILNSDTDYHKKALETSVLLIKYNRDCSNGQLSLLVNQYTVKEFKEFYNDKDNASVANYYLCEKIGMPYYYGKEKIIEISSHNIEQFLAFAGEIFSLSISKTIIGKSNRKFALNPVEQHKAIKKVAAVRFDEIPKRFNCGESIKNLLYNLCQRSLQTRNKWKNSYSGGTVTGVGILRFQLNQIMQNSEFNMLAHVLSSATSANYFEKRYISQGGQEWVVFYYNRWICVHYDLPLNYGGWFRSTLDELKIFLTKKTSAIQGESLEVIEYET